MAMQGSIDFVIQAKDLTSKPTTDIVASLEQLNLAQLAVSEGAEAASTASARFEEVQRSLLTVIAELDKRMADASAYNRNTEQMSGLQRAIDATKDKYKELTARLIESREAGNKPVAEGAKADLKTLGDSLRKLQGEYDALGRKQAALMQKGTAKGLNLADTLGTSATLQAARAQAVNTFDANAAKVAADQAALVQIEAVERAEAAKRAALEQTRAEQRAMDAAAAAEQEQYFKQRAKQLADELRLQKQRTDELKRFQDLGARALTNLDAGKQARTASTTTTAATPNTAAAAVTAALDPLAAQTKSLDGLETALAEVQSKIAALGDTSATTAVKVQSLKDIQAQLAAVSKGLAAQAGLIDSLNRQNVATDAAKLKLSEAEAEVNRLATAIKNATVVDDRMSAALVQAQQRVQGAAQAVQTQTTALDRTKAAAQSAGININNLSGEEQRLANAARETGNAQRASAEAMAKANTGALGFVGALNKLTGGGRTTLSFFQRMRGEVLSLAASFVGIQAAIGGLGKVLGAVEIEQSLNAQIVSIVGPGKAATEQMKFLHDEAVRTAYSMGVVGKSYTTVARQMKEYGLSAQTTNELIADTLTTTRSMNLSDEQTQRIFVAMGQIFDKTAIQSEELKQQLGDSGLAGVFPNLAKVMADQGIRTVGDLRKEMDKGGVAAAYMVRLMKQMAQQGQVSFDINLASYNAQLGRLGTTLYDVELSFAKGGFLRSVTQGLERLSAALKTDEAQANIQKLASALGSFLDWIGRVATDAESMHDIFTAIAIFFGGKFVLSMTVAMVNLGKFAGGLAAAGGAGASFAGILGATSKAGLWGIVVGVGVALGIMVAKIPAVKKEMDRVADAKYKDLFHDIFNTKETEHGLDRINGRLRAMASVLEKMAQDFGGGIGTTIAVAVDNLTGEAEKRYQLQLRMAQLDKDTARMREENQRKRRERGRDFQDVVGGVVSNGASSVAGPSPAAGDAADVALKMAEKATDDANAARDRLNAEADQKQLKSHKQFLEMYTAQEKSTFEALKLQRDKLSAQPMTPEVKAALATNQKAEAELNAAIRKRADEDYSKVAEQEGQKRAGQAESFNNQVLQAHERNLAKMLQSDTDYNRLAAVDEENSWAAREAAVKAHIAEERQALQKAIDQNAQLIARGQKLGLDTSGLQADNVGLQSKQARLGVEEKIALTLAQQQFNLDQQDKLETTIQTKLQLREALLENIKAKQNSGAIGQEEATDQMRSVDAQTLDGPEGLKAMIDQLIASKQAMIEAEIEMGNASDDVTLKLQLQVAQLEALKAKTEATRPGITGLQKAFNEIITRDLTQGLSNIVEQIGNAAKGMQTWGEAGRAAGDIILNMMADILEALALQIIKQTILNQLKNSGFGGGGGWQGALAQGIKAWAGSSHTGGIVGSGMHGSGTSRLVSPMVFAGATHMHSGGVPGLKSDEYATILQKNEEVLAANNPRNILNGGGKSNSTQVGSPGGGTDVHFHADAPSFFNAGLNSREGRKQMFAFFSANRSSISKVLS